MKSAMGTLAVLFLLACNNADSATKATPPASSAAGAAAGRRTRATPVCATQDCATKKIIDDGCAADGRCASCLNPCPP